MSENFDDSKRVEWKESNTMFLGEDLLGYLVLALGAAMAVGNGMALLKPPSERRDEEDLERAPVVRSLIFVIIGTVAAIWAVASLVS